MSPPNTLGLDDDLDSVELLITIERAFDITIYDYEARTITTMGDLQDLVVSKLDGAGGDRCRTSMSFYRIRRALIAVVGEVGIRPDTPLRAIWAGSPKRLFRRLQRECDLRMAPFPSTAISGFGGLLIAALIVVTPIMHDAKMNDWATWAVALGLLAAGYSLLRSDPLTFRMATVGDLARDTATENFGALVRLGGRSDAEAIWAALKEIAGKGSEILPTEKIERATVLLQSQFEKARERA